ncbi:protein TRIGALACTOSYLDIACYLGLYCEROL 4, chloroplastic-like [Cucurbita maxima]|nr:protein TRIGALACTOSYLDIACYLGLYCEROL 4, chloroplastic-like [Cucurbita maxima]
MAHLRTAMDSAFWNFDVSSSQTLVGTAKAVPGEPFPLDGARASRTLRIQQVSFLGNGFPLGILPSFSPTAHKELGSFSLQSLLLKFPAADW